MCCYGSSGDAWLVLRKPAPFAPLAQVSVELELRVQMMINAPHLYHKQRREILHSRFVFFARNVFRITQCCIIVCYQRYLPALLIANRESVILPAIKKLQRMPKQCTCTRVFAEFNVMSFGTEQLNDMYRAGYNGKAFLLIK